MFHRMRLFILQNHKLSRKNRSKVDYEFSKSEKDNKGTRRHGSRTKLNSVALVRERTIPTERPPPVGEVSANFCG